MLLWGSETLDPAQAFQFLSPGFANGSASTIAPSFRAPLAGILDRMFVRQNTQFGNGLLVYRLFVGGVPMGLSVGIAANVSDGADLVGTQNINQGDLLDVQVAGADQLGGQAPGLVLVSFRFRPV